MSCETDSLECPLCLLLTGTRRGRKAEPRWQLLKCAQMPAIPGHVSNFFAFMWLRDETPAVGPRFNPHEKGQAAKLRKGNLLCQTATISQSRHYCANQAKPSLGPRQGSDSGKGTSPRPFQPLCPACTKRREDSCEQNSQVTAPAGVRSAGQQASFA